MRVPITPASRVPTERFNVGDGAFAREQPRTRNHRRERIDEMNFGALGNFRRQLALESARNIAAELTHQWRDAVVLTVMTHSTLMPASLITLPILAISDFIVAANCSGELPTISTPSV